MSSFSSTIARSLRPFAVDANTDYTFIPHRPVCESSFWTLKEVYETCQSRSVRATCSIRRRCKPLISRSAPNEPCSASFSFEITRRQWVHTISVPVPIRPQPALIPTTQVTLTENQWWTFLEFDQNLRGPHVARQQHLSIDICSGPAPDISSKPAGRRRCCCRSTGQRDAQTDGRTDRRTDGYSTVLCGQRNKNSLEVVLIVLRLVVTYLQLLFQVRVFERCPTFFNFVQFSLSEFFQFQF